MSNTSNYVNGIFGLEGRVGIITGASSGIGFEIANVLADAGAKIYDLSRTLRETAKHENIVRIKVDVTDQMRMKEIIEGIGQEEGIDFLINNAGITKRIKAEAVDPAFWKMIHEINVDAVFFTSQLAYPYLKNSKYIGRILSISSMASYMGFSEVVPYCSTKSAVTGITRGLSVEWAGDNILVNSISPGWFKSNMNAQVLDEVRDQKIKSKIALGTYGELKDIGYMALFLLGNGANYITGQDFSVDGGARSLGY